MPPCSITLLTSSPVSICQLATLTPRSVIMGGLVELSAETRSSEISWILPRNELTAVSCRELRRLPMEVWSVHRTLWYYETASLQNHGKYRLGINGSTLYATMRRRLLFCIGCLVLIVMEHGVRAQRDCCDHRVISWSILVWLPVIEIELILHRISRRKYSCIP